MKSRSSMPCLKGFRFPREIISYAVWAYHRFALSTADVEGLLAERGIIVSREAIRLWVNRFGAHFASCIRRDRSRPNDKWHLDEVVIAINGVKHWLWRAVDTLENALTVLLFRLTKDDSLDAYDDDSKKLFARAVKKLGRPDAGQAFGFFPALAMGGAPRLKNLRIVPALEHFLFLAQLHARGAGHC